MTKVLEIIPRGTHETSNPKIVDITSSETQTETITQINPNKRIQNKTVDTQTEVPSTKKEDKNTQTTFSKKISSNQAKLKCHLTLKLR